MQESGVGPNQIAQVRGFADQNLRKPQQPFDASNRRISLIVQYLDLSKLPPGVVEPAGQPAAAPAIVNGGKAAAGKPAEVPAPGSKPAAGTKPAPGAPASKP